MPISPIAPIANANVYQPIGPYGASSPYSAGNNSYTGSVSSYDQIVALQAEEQLLSVGSGSGSGATVNDSTLLYGDLLDLSPAALNILNGIGNTTDTTAVDTALTTGSLTAAQEQQAATIIAQYSAAPVTQQTFTSIQNALTAAGINPQLLTIQQLISAYFTAPPILLPVTGEITSEVLASDLLDS